MRFGLGDIFPDRGILDLSGTPLIKVRGCVAARSLPLRAQRRGSLNR